MTQSTPSYDDLLRDNIALRLRFAEVETHTERLKRAAASAEAVFYDFDFRPGGQFLLQGMERLTGLRPEEIDSTFEWWTSRLHPEDAPAYVAGLERQLQARGVMKTMFRILHATGEWLDVESSGEAIQDDESKSIHLVGVIVNIGQRLAAEAAVRESERRYRNLADTMPFMIFTATAYGLVEYVNRPGLDYLGLRLDEAIGFGWLAKIHPVDRPISRERWLDCMKTGTAYECENRLLRADGQYRWQLARAVPIVDDNGSIIRWIGSSTDIHDRRQAELALQESRKEAERQAEELDRLYQTSPAGLAFIDRELRFVRINKTLADITGLPVAAYIGRSVREILPADLADRLEPIIRHVVEEGQPAMNVEISGDPLEEHDNARSWLANYYPLKNREGTVLGVNAVVQDITERKRTEESLKKSHAFVRQIIDTNPNFVFVKDRQGRFTLVNQAVADCYGTTVEGLLGKTDADFNPNQEEVAHFEQQDREVIDSRKDLFIAEETITDASGSVRWLQTVKRPLFDEQGGEPHVLGVSTEITHRKLAADALRKSEERFRTLADNISQFAWMADAAGWRIWYNRRWYEYTGATFEEVQGWGWEKFHHPDHLERVREAWRKARERGEPWEDTFPVRGRDGRYRWFLSHATPIRDDAGQITRWFGTKTDVTDLREAQEGLRESEERLRLALAGGEMGAWDVDLVNDTTRWDSKEFALLGLSEGSVSPSPKQFYRQAHPEDEPVIRQSVQRAINETGALEHEFRIVLSDGQIRWLAAKGRVLKDEQGKPVRMIGVNFDVTERKLAEARVRSFTHELETRVEERTGELVHLHGRLRALTTDLNLTEQRERKRLATDLHDYLAQLLALVRMKLGQIKRLAPPPALVEIVRETELVVNEALTYTRTLVTQLSPPVLHEFGLLAALRWLAEQMVRQELSVEVRQSVPDKISLPEDQAVLLFQSVRELLINVRKHAGTHQAVVTIELQDGQLRITVRDEGAGVDLALASAATDQPSSTSSKFGLFSIRERMLAIGGQFEVASAPGQGMTAQLILPIVSRSDTPVRSAESLRETATAGRPVCPVPSEADTDSDFQQDVHCIRVLLVDDHPLVREGVRGLLQEHGDIAIVGEAWDGEEAIAFVDKLRPDCVLMDVNMPKIDGIEATRRIKAAFGQTVIVGISVNTSKELEAAMRGAGADEFLSKGAPADVMYRAIVDTTSRHMQHKVEDLPSRCDSALRSM
jgi:PAS domain S-box-containing protein